MASQGKRFYVITRQTIQVERERHFIVTGIEPRHTTEEILQHLSSSRVVHESDSLEKKGPVIVTSIEPYEGGSLYRM